MWAGCLVRCPLVLVVTGFAGVGLPPGTGSLSLEGWNQGPRGLNLEQSCPQACPLPRPGNLPGAPWMASSVAERPHAPFSRGLRPSSWSFSSQGETESQTEQAELLRSQWQQDLHPPLSQSWCLQKLCGFPRPPRDCDSGSRRHFLNKALSLESVVGAGSLQALGSAVGGVYCPQAQT